MSLIPVGRYTPPELKPSERYRLERRRRGSQREVAKKLGLCRGTIAKRESGEIAVSPEMELALKALPLKIDFRDPKGLHERVVSEGNVVLVPSQCYKIAKDELFLRFQGRTQAYDIRFAREELEKLVSIVLNPRTLL